MSVTYAWKVLSIKTQDVNVDLQQAVVHAKWRKTGTDEGGNVGVFDGACMFSVANVTAETFIPYNQLSEEIVLGWVKDILNRGGMDRIDDLILKQINEGKTSTVEVPLPWANNS